MFLKRFDYTMIDEKSVEQSGYVYCSRVAVSDSGALLFVDNNNDLIHAINSGRWVTVTEEQI